MCLIAYSPKAEARLTEKEVRSAWESNPHGAGFMFAVDGKLTIRKPYWTADEFWIDYSAVPETAPVVAHFRFATHGPRTRKNTHPHGLCGGKVGLVHNGILPVSPGYVHSDTKYWAETVFYGRPAEQIMSGSFRHHIEELIDGNKIVLLSAVGEASIFNERRGFWENGRWFSGPCAIRPPLVQSCASYFTSTKRARHEPPKDDDSEEAWWAWIREEQTALQEEEPPRRRLLFKK